MRDSSWIIIIGKGVMWMAWKRVFTDDIIWSKRPPSPPRVTIMSTWARKVKVKVIYLNNIKQWDRIKYLNSAFITVRFDKQEGKRAPFMLLRKGNKLLVQGHRAGKWQSWVSTYTSTLASSVFTVCLCTQQTSRSRFSTSFICSFHADGFSDS